MHMKQVVNRFKQWRATHNTWFQRRCWWNYTPTVLTLHCNNPRAMHELRAWASHTQAQEQEITVKVVYHQLTQHTRSL